MTSGADNEDGERVAQEWCERKGPGWALGRLLGKGGTAPVFEVESPEGPRALKIYDLRFSSGEKGEIEHRRIQQQLTLCGHDCPYLVQVYEGGEFQDRLFILMARAPGDELEKRLLDVPRSKIPGIVDQVARAALFLKKNDLCHRDIKSANVFISDDFEKATLLDISVIRGIHDPVGVGTDHDGQLPVVATARYSPPEYLFRLLDPSPELWHALTIYQLGALLHDLIMKKPLFQAEYLRSAENRYRFAWVVATSVPTVQAADVDQGLIFAARRALDKNWERRSVLSLEDFLADSNIQQARALQMLGLASEERPLIQRDDVSVGLRRITDISRHLEDALDGRLRRKGAVTEHFIVPGQDDHSKLLTFRWATAMTAGSATSESIELQVTLSRQAGWDRYWFTSSATLSTETTDRARRAILDLPDVEDTTGAESYLIDQIERALPVLAIQLGQPQDETSGG